MFGGFLRALARLTERSEAGMKCRDISTGLPHSFLLDEPVPEPEDLTQA